MLRSNGARLACWFALRSVVSNIDDDSSIMLNKYSLRQGNSREFGLGICNSSRFLGNSENGNQRDGVWCGVSHYLKTLFHATSTEIGSTNIAGRANKDYHDKLGKSGNAGASEYLKAYLEEQQLFNFQHEIEKIRFDIEKIRIERENDTEKMRDERRKDIEKLHGEMRAEHKAANNDVISGLNKEDFIFSLFDSVMISALLCLFLFGFVIFLFVKRKLDWKPSK